METQYQHTENGQEVRQQDINSMSGAGAIADDRVLWELFRTAPFDSAPQKAVIPSGTDGWPDPATTNSTALVHADPVGGRVRVRPCRVIVGSTDTTGLDRIRNIRSGYLQPDTDEDYQVLAISNNAAGNPRWTLVYAKIEPNKDGDSANVIVKDPSTGVAAQQTVVLNLKTSVTIGTVDGAAAGSPTRPSLPADGAGAYYVALAYCLIPAGFNSGTVLGRERIAEVAPVVTLNSATGAMTLRPANQQHKVGGTVDTNQSGGGASQYRPGAYLPSTMVGGEQRIILIQNHLSPASHADGDVVDDSCDWRFRYFKWSIFAKSGNTTAAAFASDRQATGTALVPSAWGAAAASSGGFGTFTLTGMGQSFVDDSSGVLSTPVTDGYGAVLALRAANFSLISGILLLYVRDTDGALIVRFEGTVDIQIFIWLEATGPYSNHGVLT